MIYGYPYTGFYFFDGTQGSINILCNGTCYITLKLFFIVFSDPKKQEIRDKKALNVFIV
jgi:hypothetical protein